MHTKTTGGERLLAIPRRRSVAALAAASVLMVATHGCSSTDPGISQVGLLDAAEEALAEGQPKRALRIARAVPTRGIGAELDARRRFVTARALHEAGSSWRAFRQIRGFAERYRFSRVMPAVQQLELDIGRTLIRSDGGNFLTGWDAASGVAVLEHFRQRYPTHRGGADALRLLGEYSFARGSYDRAAERYRQLLSEYRLSEWEPLASFRLAMCRFLVLQGPAYDERAMLDAQSELQGYLQLQPERPEFRTQAEAALATVEAWLAERQLIVANYYRRIEQPRGQRFHLERIVNEYPDSKFVDEARRRLARLSDAPPARSRPTSSPTGGSR